MRAHAHIHRRLNKKSAREIGAHSECLFGLFLVIHLAAEFLKDFFLGLALSFFSDRVTLIIGENGFSLSGVEDEI